MKNDLETRTKRFALSIIELVGKLPHCKASEVIGYQLLKSGTSIGANYREATRAQSRDDFIYKIGICEKGDLRNGILARTRSRRGPDRIGPQARSRYERLKSCWRYLWRAARQQNQAVAPPFRNPHSAFRISALVFVASGRTAKSRR
jgi:hypothetical protein